MMKCADDSAGEKNRGRKQSRPRRGADFDELEPCEEEPDHHRGEYFKEALDPEMNHPPAPVLRGNKIAALSIHQPRGIKQRYGDARNQEENQQRAVFALAHQRRLERRPHHHQPQHQADKQQYLPEPAQVNILITLAAEPEPEIAQALLNAHPFAGQRAAHHKNQRAEKYVHP